MDRRETFIFTHYSDIADEKKRDVRNLQSEAARSIMLGMRKALLRVVRRVSSSKNGLKQSRAKIGFSEQ